MQIVQIDDSNTVIRAFGTSLPLATQLSDRYCVAPDHVGAGWQFAPELAAFQPPGRRRWLTKLAFSNRFTTEESVRLKLAQVLPGRVAGESDTEYLAKAQLAAQLQVLNERQNLATYIDLDREDTRAGVTALEQLGLLAPGRAAEILDAEVAPHEFHPEA